MKPFQEYFADAVQRAALAPRSLDRGECQSPRGEHCSLCSAIQLTYPDESTAKQGALRLFWGDLRIDIPLQPLVLSPRGRAYRTVSKRKAVFNRGEIRLGLIDPSAEGAARSFEAVRCAIEPPEHAALYRQVRAELHKPGSRNLAEALSYVIVKGSYQEFTLVFNVREITPAIVRSANAISKSLTRRMVSIAGVFLFHGDTENRYYMARRSATSAPALRRIHGKRQLSLRLLGRRFTYSPTSFSQVNASILEALVTTAGNLLDLSGNETLFDLYCGYGLFGLCLSGRAGHVSGVERSPDSVEAARENAMRQGATNARFFRGDITPEFLTKVMQHCRPEDGVLLDPPRGGTAPGVIEFVAARGPARALHMFCAIDLIPGEVDRWRSGGYELTQAIPFDLFPGTADVEMLLLFERRRIQA